MGYRAWGMGAWVRGWGAGGHGGDRLTLQHGGGAEMREADQHQVRQHLDVVVVDQSGDVWGRWVRGRVGSMGRGSCGVDGSGAGGRGVDRLTLQHGGGAEMREADQHQVRQHLDVVVVDQSGDVWGRWVRGGGAWGRQTHAAARRRGRDERGGPASGTSTS